MGVQLSGILLAGIGLVFLGRLVLDGALTLLPQGEPRLGGAAGGRGLVAGLCIVALVIVLAPAWSELDTYDAHNATNIGLQAEADAQQDPQIDRCSPTCARTHGAGSTPGPPTNWGNDFLSATCRCSSTSRARTSTRSATRCARRR